MNDAGRLTVLIADAHEPYRSGLVRAIAMHLRLMVAGVAEDGLAALSLITGQRPDLALVDVRLPNLDGFALSQLLMSSEHQPRTRVLLLTAVLDQGQQARARAVGAVACLAKDTPRWEICEALIAAAAASEQAAERNQRQALAGGPVLRLPASRARKRDCGPDGRAA